MVRGSSLTRYCGIFHLLAGQRLASPGITLAGYSESWNTSVEDGRVDFQFCDSGITLRLGREICGGVAFLFRCSRAARVLLWMF